jgi:hypothetical protein
MPGKDRGAGPPGSPLTDDHGPLPNSSSRSAVDGNRLAPISGTTTAYKRVVDLLRGMGKKVRPGVGQTMAQCPSHDDREASLAIYSKPGKVKLVCFAGCHEELDILPALGLSWPDKYDDPRGWRNRSGWRPDPAIKARSEARRSMGLVERAVDDLLQLPDLGERLCRGIAWARPELYTADRLAGDDHD